MNLGFHHAGHEGPQAFHLVTDLDGTWLPSFEGFRALRRIEGFLASRPDIVLTFATGRNLEAAQEAISTFELLRPRFLITDVGSAIFHQGPNGRWVEDSAWAEWVSSIWNPVAANRLVDGFLPAQVQLQPGVVPRRRLALYIDREVESQLAAEGIREACLHAGLKADVLPSHGCFLDVLPPGVNKGTALAFLQESLGLPRPIVGCGDSANDLGLFEVADLPVLVGQGLAESELSEVLSARLHRALQPGPMGIHSALVQHGLMKEEHHDC